LPSGSTTSVTSTSGTSDHQRAAQLGDARGGRHPVPLALERGGDHRADRAVVVDDQDRTAS
jgi:hypothetical protein